MTPDLLSTEGWSGLVSRLPADQDLATLARRHGAFERSRQVRNADDLLRLALIYGNSPLSLRGTAAWASAEGLASLSDVALLFRLQGCDRWLEALVSDLLSRAVPAGPVLPVSRRVRLIDATVLSSPGAGAGAWRLHADYDLARQRFIGLALSDRHGAESLARFAPAAGDLIVGDRYYAKAGQLAAVVDAGADFLVRRGLTSCRLCHADGRRLDMGGLIAGLSPAQSLEMAVLVPRPEGDGGAPLQARLLIRHVGEARAEAARRRAKRKAAKNGQTASQKRLKAAEYVMLLTSLPSDQASADTLFQVYRLRWQIELAFKRLKSLMGLDQLLAKEPKLVRSCLYAKLILALITEDITAKLLDSFPSAPGYAGTIALAAAAADLSAVDRNDPLPRPR